MKSTNASNILSKIPDCIIDSNGVFKYIQIYIKDIFENKSKYIVRGFKKYKFHADNFYDFSNIELPKYDALKFIEFECVGGGRLDINQENKTIFVYGYSQSYGRCDHSVSCEIIKQNFPDYNITWSNEGY